MESIYPRQKKKKDKKPLFILAGVVIFFGVFIYLITRPSNQSKALKDLDISFNRKDVEMVWYKYKSDLYQDEDFLFAIRTKLASFNLTEKEEEQCISWLPVAPKSINLIVIPDLSRRIIDTINNPNQTKNDLYVLQTIWKSFVNYSKLKQNTKDRLIIDVTDIDQARGQFDNVANDLQFDLSNHTGKSNLLFFTDEKTTQFNKSIVEMYKLAKQKPLGADYRFYLRRYLKNHLKKSTLFDNYINKIVIITDGYLEPENAPADTKISGYEVPLHKAVLSGSILNFITSNGLNIPKVNINLSNAEILICEVNERKSGKGYDFDVLQTYWEDWFKRMNVKKINFIQREQANELTADRIKKFILQ
ncbi:hypothetical protein [Flavobacterium aquidurense]|uniref:hypothetical protein n=1 Tax=Flavobacterium aquidurense TaxID=362413 RepID=UPI00285DAB52|nr:hypothetical protein [Flavobacterium aquidurense]MDR7371321.1 hypothetical protein [Flavobacterium aquidurense]